jgi:UDP-N-acetylmuramoyl-L-alanyl-D-glutamate--2,6-diaminopimelate ligase
MLADLLADAPEVRVRQRVRPERVRITGIAYDSRRVVPGALFCCLTGERVDGHDYAQQALDAGATALLTERLLPLDAAQVVVDDSRAAMAHIAAAFNGHPSRRLAVFGITGTTGKTTTAHLLRAVLTHAGRPCGILGTLSGAHTTPEAPDLQGALADFAAAGKAAVAVEVSSHALALHRVDATWFTVAVFTNLGRDHLDFHGTPERYFAAKASLFEPSRSAAGVVNVDDSYGRLLADAASIPVTPFSGDDASDLVTAPHSCSFRWRRRLVRLPLGGRFNVTNAVAAATAASVAGVDEDAIVAGLAAATPVPGRFEPVSAGQPFSVLVDYAHTPESLASVLGAARAVAGSARVIVVFGCGGDRDPSKRELMGATAAAGADTVVVTSDNPRGEDPAAIISAVIGGLEPSDRARVVAETDRRRAIGLALASARPGDVVVIAGKGHETTQTIGPHTLPFDDRAVARDLLEEQAR